MMKIKIEEEIQKIELAIDLLSNPETPLEESSRVFKESIQKIDNLKKYLETEQEQIKKIIEVD